MLLTKTWYKFYKNESERVRELIFSIYQSKQMHASQSLTGCSVILRYLPVKLSEKFKYPNGYFSLFLNCDILFGLVIFFKNEWLKQTSEDRFKLLAQI